MKYEPPNFEKYDSSLVEKAVMTLWESHDAFFVENPTITITMPPPNITGRLHIGHSLMLSIQDAIVRLLRMRGHVVAFLPGTDHAGIATQAVLERTRLSKNLSRDEKLAEAKKWRTEYETHIYSQMKRMGVSCDYKKSRFTMDEGYAKAVTRAFVELAKRGLIKRMYRMVNWSAGIQSVLSDLEVDHKPVCNTRIAVDGGNYLFGVLYYFKYPIVELEKFKTLKHTSESDIKSLSGYKYIEIATTRPETILGDTAICSSKKYDGFIAINPLTMKMIPIINDEAADSSFGTGSLKVTPCADHTDFELKVKYNLDMQTIMNDRNYVRRDMGVDIIDFNDKFTDVKTAPEEKKEKFRRFNYRIEVIKYLKNTGLYIKDEPYNTVVPICSRTGDVVEPRLMMQWWLECEGMAKKALESNIKFHPVESIKQWKNWLLNIKDWCLSRQLWWGHRVPAYKVLLSNKKDGACDAVQKFEDLKIKNEIFNEESFNNSRGESSKSSSIDSLKMSGEFSESTETFNSAVFDSIKLNEELIEGLNKTEQKHNESVVVDTPEGPWIVAEFLEDAERRAQKEFGCTVEQDVDVLDTWFSSGLWPMVLQGWPGDWKTTDLLETGSDILFFWVARMAMLSIEISNQLPFDSVLLHGIVRDKENRKMSKSIGNVIDPMYVIDGASLNELNESISPNLSLKEKNAAIKNQKKWYPNGINRSGADALRFTLLSYVSGTKDICLDLLRVDGYRKLCNKIWNAYLYIYGTDKYCDRSNERNIENSQLKNKEGDCGSRNENICDDHGVILHYFLKQRNNTIRQVIKHMDEYNFMMATQTVYSFFYMLCDVLIEINKVTSSHHLLLKSLFVDCLLLLHPFMPFITEDIYQRINKNDTLIMKQDIPVIELCENCLLGIDDIYRSENNILYAKSGIFKIGLCDVCELKGDFFQDYLNLAAKLRSELTEDVVIYISRFGNIISGLVKHIKGFEVDGVQDLQFKEIKYGITAVNKG